MNRMRTIMAVYKKEFLMLVRYPTWIIQIIVWPLIFPLIYILSAVGFSGPDMSGLENFQQLTGTDNYMAYIIIGTITWMWVNMLLWSFGSFLRQEQMLGTLESNWLTPTKRFDLLIGNGLLTLSIVFVMNVVAIIEYMLIYRIEFNANPLMWFFIYLIMIPGAFGIGSFFSSLVLLLRETNALVNVARGIIMIVCGITFPILVLPNWLKVISYTIPFTHGIEAARKIMLNGYSISQAIEPIMYTLLIGMVYVLIGYLFFKYLEHVAKVKGSFDRY